MALRQRRAGLGLDEPEEIAMIRLVFLILPLILTACGVPFVPLI